MLTKLLEAQSQSLNSRYNFDPQSPRLLFFALYESSVILLCFTKYFSYLLQFNILPKNFRVCISHFFQQIPPSHFFKHFSACYQAYNQNNKNPRTRCILGLAPVRSDINQPINQPTDRMECSGIFTFSGDCMAHYPTYAPRQNKFESK